MVDSRFFGLVGVWAENIFKLKSESDLGYTLGKGHLQHGFTTGESLFFLNAELSACPNSIHVLQA